MNQERTSSREPKQRPMAGAESSGPITRSTFLARMGLAFFGTLAGSAARAGAADDDGVTRPTSRPGTRPFAGKGRPESLVQRWDVVTIGNLSRNRYWGEPDAKGLRPA